MTKKKCYFCEKKSKHCKGYLLNFGPFNDHRVYLCKECINEQIVNLWEGETLIESLDETVQDVVNKDVPY